MSVHLGGRRVAVDAGVVRVGHHGGDAGLGHLRGRLSLVLVGGVHRRGSGGARFGRERVGEVGEVLGPREGAKGGVGGRVPAGLGVLSVAGEGFGRQRREALLVAVGRGRGRRGDGRVAGEGVRVERV